MTLANCKRWFEHYTSIGDSANAEEMKKRIAAKGGQVQSKAAVKRS